MVRLHVKNIVAANSYIFKGGAGDTGVIYIKSIVFFIARRASLGLGQPEVKPSTPEPMPVRLKELTGKLGWMKWEPLPLFSEGRRSLGSGVVSGCSAKAEKKARRWRKGTRRAGQE